MESWRAKVFLVSGRLLTGGAGFPPRLQSWVLFASFSLCWSHEEPLSWAVSQPTAIVHLHSLSGNGAVSWVPSESNLPAAVLGHRVFRCPQSTCLVRCRDSKSWAPHLRKSQTPEQLAVVSSILSAYDSTREFRGKWVAGSPSGLKSLSAMLSRPEGPWLPTTDSVSFELAWFITSDTENPQQGVFRLSLGWKECQLEMGHSALGSSPDPERCRRQPSVCSPGPACLLGSLPPSPFLLQKNAFSC